MKTVQRRSLAALVGLLAGVLLLTGCMPQLQLGREELPAYSVLQLPKKDGNWNFSFIDSQGEEQPMSCQANGLFEKRSCASADGVVSFEFSVRKSKPRIYTLTVDGSERSMSRVSEDIPEVKRVWVTDDVLEELTGASSVPESPED